MLLHDSEIETENRRLLTARIAQLTTLEASAFTSAPNVRLRPPLPLPVGAEECSRTPPCLHISGLD